VPALFNTVRTVLSENGVSETIADALTARLGDDFLDAVNDQPRESFQIDDPPRRVGMTETQASMRWCPMAREIVANGTNRNVGMGNRYQAEGGDYANPAGCRCIASACMFWRWANPRLGYCGLAGTITYQPANEPRNHVNRSPLERPNPGLAHDLLDDSEDGCASVDRDASVVRELEAARDSAIIDMD
jgi:hypothetical protein